MWVKPNKRLVNKLTPPYADGSIESGLEASKNANRQ